MKTISRNHTDEYNHARIKFLIVIYNVAHSAYQRVFALERAGLSIIEVTLITITYVTTAASICDL